MLSVKKPIFNDFLLVVTNSEKILSSFVLVELLRGNGRLPIVRPQSTEGFGVPQETGNPWTVLTSTTKYENAWIEVVEHKVLTPKGNPGIYGVVRPRGVATGVVPIDDQGRVTLVGQYRFPLEQYSWEIPEGGGDKSVDPQKSAARELLEETGQTARHWLPLMTSAPVELHHRRGRPHLPRLGVGAGNRLPRRHRGSGRPPRALRRDGGDGDARRDHGFHGGGQPVQGTAHGAGRLVAR